MCLLVPSRLCFAELKSRRNRAVTGELCDRKYSRGRWLTHGNDW